MYRFTHLYNMWYNTEILYNTVTRVLYNMATPEIDVAGARKTLGNLIASIAKGEVDEIVITRYGKPQAKLVAVEAATAPVATPKAPKRPEQPLEIEGAEVDDWGLPVDPHNTAMTDRHNEEFGKPAMSPSEQYRAAVAKLAEQKTPSGREAKETLGLSKSQQAGGKYER